MFHLLQILIYVFIFSCLYFVVMKMFSVCADKLKWILLLLANNFASPIVENITVKYSNCLISLCFCDRIVYITRYIVPTNRPYYMLYIMFKRIQKHIVYIKFRLCRCGFILKHQTTSIIAFNSSIQNVYLFSRPHCCRYQKK